MSDLIHGDCMKVLPRLIDERGEGFAKMVIVDPPYQNVVSERWDNGQDVVTDDLCELLFRCLDPSGNLYCWCGIGERSQSLIRWFPVFSRHFHFKDMITWKKQRGVGMRKGWLYTREEAMWFVRDNRKFQWNREHQYSDILRKSIHKTRARSPYMRHTNVWDDIVEESFAVFKKRTEMQRFHVTPKPIRALERMILAHTDPGDVVLDPMAGSGSTAVAAMGLGREYVCVERNEDYYRGAEQRIRAHLL